MKFFTLLITIACALYFTSCASEKNLVQPRTLAQICADSFPVRTETRIDTFWEIHNFPVPEIDTFYLDTVQCPPGLTDTLRITVFKPITIPARTVSVPVFVRDTIVKNIDSALVEAYKDLQAQYAKTINDLENCQIEKEAIQKIKRPSTWWLWMVVIGLAVIVGLQLAGGRR